MMTMRYGLWLILGGVLMMACARKEILLPQHKGGQIYHGLMRSDVRCYRCHGDAGQGTAGAPALIQNGQVLPADLFIHTVMEGRNRMPPFRSALTEAEAGDIRDWLTEIAALPK